MGKGRRANSIQYFNSDRIAISGFWISKMEHVTIILIHMCPYSYPLYYNTGFNCFHTYSVECLTSSVVIAMLFPQTGALGMASLSKKMAAVFEEESDDDKTFYGFSDSEKSDVCDIKVWLFVLTSKSVQCHSHELIESCSCSKTTTRNLGSWCRMPWRLNAIVCRPISRLS